MTLSGQMATLEVYYCPICLAAFGGGRRSDVAFFAAHPLPDGILQTKLQ
jgi:hypothetical protein